MGLISVFDEDFDEIGRVFESFGTCHLQQENKECISELASSRPDFNCGLPYHRALFSPLSK